MSKTLKHFCEKLHVDMEPSLYKLSKVQHLATFFRGKLHEHANLLCIVEKLHPTPAVAGFPVFSALKFLREHEKFDRGWYAGSVGWLDKNKNGEFMVALRSGLIHGQNATLFAGCGLVSGSQSEQEFMETQLKFTTMLDAIIPSSQIL